MLMQHATEARVSKAESRAEFSRYNRFSRADSAAKSDDQRSPPQHRALQPIYSGDDEVVLVVIAQRLITTTPKEYANSCAGNGVKFIMIRNGWTINGDTEGLNAPTKELKASPLTGDAHDVLRGTWIAFDYRKATLTERARKFHSARSKPLHTRN